MADDATSRKHAATSAEVAAILAHSATQPGLNEVLALLRLTTDVQQVQEFYAQMAPVGVATQSSNLRTQGH
jgi:hypothetical protein